MEGCAGVLHNSPKSEDRCEVPAHHRQRLEMLVCQHSRLVFQIAFVVLRRREEAEDVVQELFLKLLRFSTLEKIADEKAYLARCAWRMAVGRRRSIPVFLNDEVELRSLASQELSPELLAIKENRLALLRQMIAGLPAELRDPLQLSTVRELNSQEIGEVLGIPEGTVRTRMMRARQMLKDRLKMLQEAESHDVER